MSDNGRRELTNPVVNPEVWENVVKNHVPGTKLLSSNNQKSNHSGNTKISLDN